MQLGFYCFQWIEWLIKQKICWWWSVYKHKSNMVCCEDEKWFWFCLASSWICRPKRVGDWFILQMLVSLFALWSDYCGYPRPYSRNDLQMRCDFSAFFSGKNTLLRCNQSSSVVCTLLSSHVPEIFIYILMGFVWQYAHPFCIRPTKISTQICNNYSIQFCVLTSWVLFGNKRSDISVWGPECDFAMQMSCCCWP